MAGGWGTDWGTDWGGGWDVPGGSPIRRLQGTIQNLRPKALRSNLKLFMWSQPPEVVEEVKCDPLVEIECVPVEVVSAKEEVEKELEKDEAFDRELAEATTAKED